MLQPNDPTLVKIVHDEEFRGHRIIASLNRFGGLYVYISRDDQFVRDTDNILKARDWVAEQTGKFGLRLVK